MKILFITPLPPPIHGQSYVSQVLLEDLELTHTLEIINTSKDNSRKKWIHLHRVFDVYRIIQKVRRHRKGNDAIYITISESFAGNIKDLLTYFCLIGSLSKIVIHLHGGTIKKQLWNKRPLLYEINKLFIKKFGGVIISGLSHQEIFQDMIDSNRIHIVPNFAPEYLFISENELINKFQNLNPLKILYISGLREKKGYLDLLHSFSNLTKDTKKKVRIDFAGAFESEDLKEEFLERIKSIEQIQYQGIVDEMKKKELFSKSHIFCLPTKYYEGQPISILEAYASGCVVLTTELGGIIDIFTNNQNGFTIQPGNSQSISTAIEYCISNSEDLMGIASRNRLVALENYKMKTYTTSIKKTIETIK